MQNSPSLPRLSIGAVGVGISTRGVLRYLGSQGVHRVTLRAPQREDAHPLPFPPQVRWRTGDGYLSDIDEDILYLSPAVRRDQAPLYHAAARGTVLSSDAELFFSAYRGHAFCVSGSDGKSTTVTLAARLLEHGDFSRVRTGGNIGTALSPFLTDSREGDAYAVELSSFQLMYLSPRCRRALITNVTENHLNWHTDMREYAEAKGHIYEHAEECVLHADDPLCRTLLPRAPYAVYSMTESPRALARLHAHTALYLSGDHIAIDGRRLLPLDDIALPGRHGIQNVLAALALTHGCIDPAAVRDAVRGFRGLPHRMTPVGTVHGVTYIDSSIDSSPARTLTTLHAMKEPPILILCGRSKNVSERALIAALPETVKAVVCTGELGQQLYPQLCADKGLAEASCPVLLADTLEDAVLAAARIARSGDTVLLSPAATSFDAYRSFEERGRAFALAVEALKN